MKRTQSIPPCDRYRELAERVASGPDAGAPWLIERRRYAMELVAQRGFPTRRQEAWKYTDLSGLAKRSYSLPGVAELDGNTLATHPLLGQDEFTIVLLDGRFCPALSSTDLPEAVELVHLTGERLGEAGAARKSIEQTNPQMQSSFTNLNEALWQEGLSVIVRPTAGPAPRLHIMNVVSGYTADALITPRLFVSIADTAAAQVALSTSAWGPSPSNTLNLAVTDIQLGASSQLQLCQFQDLPSGTHHVGTTRIRQERDSSLHSLDVAVGGDVSRQELSVMLNAPGATTTVDGIYLADGARLVDNHTTIEHSRPNCTSRQLYKGVITDKARAVFNGCVRVHPGASGTDGEQTNRNLLLSPTATVDTKPELQIANDDVRCTHGATIGQLDPQELFYLHSRGIAPKAARTLLARGFVGEVLLRYEDESWCTRIGAAIDRFFDATEGGRS